MTACWVMFIIYTTICGQNRNHICFFLPSHVKVELQRVSDGERCLTVLDVGADLAVNL